MKIDLNEVQKFNLTTAIAGAFGLDEAAIDDVSIEFTDAGFYRVAFACSRTMGVEHTSTITQLLATDVRIF